MDGAANADALENFQYMRMDNGTTNPLNPTQGSQLPPDASAHRIAPLTATTQHSSEATMSTEQQKRMDWLSAENRKLRALLGSSDIVTANNTECKMQQLWDEHRHLTNLVHASTHSVSGGCRDEADGDTMQELKKAARTLSGQYTSLQAQWEELQPRLPEHSQSMTSTLSIESGHFGGDLTMSRISQISLPELPDCLMFE